MKVAFLDTVHPILLERLDACGYECIKLYSLSREEILDGYLQDFEGIVLRSRITLDARILAELSNIKWIARSGSGLENIDVEEAEARGISIINSPEGNRDAVGEHTLGLLLMMLHKLKSGDLSVHKRLWLREEHRGDELGAQTVGIIGYGNMGSAFAEKLKGLGCRVIAYDKYKRDFGSEFVEEVNEEQFFLDSDIVSVHLPWTSETKGLINANWLNRFSKPITFINTSRGAIVNTSDLLDAVDYGKVRSAALDVIEFEGRSLEGLELDNVEAETLDRLLKNDQILITPHVAGWSVESYYKLSSVLADKIILLNQS
tara:strand:+ start:135 stop:1082 length:948 start_codon:yes stop_codon:yes gene_type:complete